MALKVLMLRKKIDDAKKTLENLRNSNNFEVREKELEESINEAETEEEKRAVEDAVTQFESDKAEFQKNEKSLEEEIRSLEAELATEENAQNNGSTEGEDEPEPENIATPTENENEERNKKMDMNIRTNFFNMTVEQRNRFFADEQVKNFISEVRSCIKEKRALVNVGLTIPDTMLGLMRENILKYSKLIKHINLKPVSGTARINVMGTIPEAVWTEMCANLNELSLTFNQAEVDGYKVGGFFAVCNAVLEDSDYDLASEIITALSQSIGYALDKAILYGTGTKMPLGIVSRLAQTSEPADYPSVARTWVDLHTSNILSIANTVKGADLFKAIVIDSGAAKGKYSRGTKFWVMNETTYTKIMSEAISINAAGAIVSGVNATMPVVGGVIEVLDFIPDNVIIGGYGDLYLLAERKGVQLGQSEHYRFLEDQTVFKGTARYDGLPVIAEGFVAIGLAGVTPNASMTFAEDNANPSI